MKTDRLLLMFPASEHTNLSLVHSEFSKIIAGYVKNLTFGHQILAINLVSKCTLKLSFFCRKHFSLRLYISGAKTTSSLQLSFG